MTFTMPVPQGRFIGCDEEALASYGEKVLNARPGGIISITRAELDASLTLREGTEDEIVIPL